MTEPALKPASKLFAWELAYASPIQGDKNRCRTPFGIHSKEIAYIGTLTEILTSGDTVTSLRVSDPTGVCLVHIDPRIEGLAEKAAQLEAPSFLYVFGTIQTRRASGTAEISATVLKPVSRDARNGWILQTAADTAERLEKREKDEQTREFAKVIIDALGTIQKAPAKQALSDEDILDIIHSLYEGRSAPRDKVMTALINRGLTETQAKDTLARLMEEGECYAPKPDVIKLA